MDRYTIIGNLGRDAETRTLSGGHVITSFAVAVTENWKDKQGNKQSRTTWIDCKFWGEGGKKLAEYLIKGKKVLVEGRPTVRAWVKKDDPEKAMAILELNVDNIEFLGGGSKEQSSAATTTESVDLPAEKKEEDLPF